MDTADDAEQSNSGLIRQRENAVDVILLHGDLSQLPLAIEYSADGDLQQIIDLFGRVLREFLAKPPRQYDLGQPDKL